MDPVDSAEASASTQHFLNRVSSTKLQHADAVATRIFFLHKQQDSRQKTWKVGFPTDAITVGCFISNLWKESKTRYIQKKPSSLKNLNALKDH